MSGSGRARSSADPAEGGCPKCGGRAWTYCHACEAYVADLRAELEEPEPEAAPDPSIPAGDPSDPRREKAVRTSAKALLRAREGWAVWDLEQERKTRQDPGPADWIVAGHGVVAFIEWKRPDGSTGQTPAQREFEGWVTGNGGTYVVMRTEVELLEWVRLQERGAGSAAPH